MEDRFFLGDTMRAGLFLGLLIVIFPLTTAAHAAMIYSSDGIIGSIVDGETDQPLEGAVVVADWEVRQMTLVPAGEGGTNVDFVRLKTVTNRDGHYVIPAWGPKAVSPNQVMQGKNSASITIYKIGYWTKYLLDVEPDFFAKRYADISKLDNSRLINKCRSFSTQFEEAVGDSIPYDYLAPSHRKSIWNDRTIKIKRIIPGEELRCGEEVLLCEAAKKKYGEDIKCEGQYFKKPIVRKVTDDDLYEQIANIFKDKNTCRDILKVEPGFSQEGFKKYPLRAIFKKCNDILKEDGK
jgi:hypothetical protein